MSQHARRPGSARPGSRSPQTLQRVVSQRRDEQEEPRVFDVNKQLHEWDPSEIHGRCMGHLWHRSDTSRMFKRGKKTGYQCLACHNTVDDITNHDNKLVSACRPTFTVLSEYPPREKLTVTHHWVKGSYPKGKVCDFCSKQLGQRKLGTTQRALRCAWCKRVLHEGCLKNKKDAWGKCDMGDYRTIIAGPNDIHLHPVPVHLRSTAAARTAPGVSLTADDVDMIDAERRHQRAQIRDSTPDLSFTVSQYQSLAAAARRASAPSPHAGSRKDLLVMESLHEDAHESVVDANGNDDDDADDDGDDAEFDEQFNQQYAGVLEKMSEEKRRSFRNSMKRARRLKDRAVNAAVSAVDRTVMTDGSPLQFSIRPQRPSAYPLLVFVNPKSGGNQGIKLMRHFMWHLNPRQVFNIMARDDSGNVIGPKPALSMFGRTPNLRILVCGGDGTIGWVLQSLDELNLSDLHIPVGTIPLGTGNDMARSLKMGGGYEGEPAGKLLNSVINSVSTQLDRWSLTIDDCLDFDEEAYARSSDVPLSRELPLNVCNNYFSFGTDAWAALNFHLARERDPAKFSSRMHNKAYYGIQGAKDIFQHKYKNLHTMVRLWCDDTDYTDVIKRKSLEAIAFLNIYSYGAGTRPWGTKAAVDSFAPPRLDDGKVEVVGFSSALALARGVMHLGHAYRICQCSRARIEVLRPLPVQVDGEPCMLGPCIINFTFKNQATMLCRPKGRFLRDLEEGRTGRCFPEQSAARLAVGDDDDDEDDDDSRTGSPLPEVTTDTAPASKRTSSEDPVLWTGGSSRPGTSSGRRSPINIFRSRSPGADRPTSAGGSRRSKRRPGSPSFKALSFFRPRSPGASLRSGLARAESPTLGRALVEEDSSADNSRVSGDTTMDDDDSALGRGGGLPAGKTERKDHRMDDEDKASAMKPRPTTAPASPSGRRSGRRQESVTSRAAQIEDQVRRTTADTKKPPAHETPVYVVPLSSSSRTRPLRYAGSYDIDPSISLKSARPIISKAINRAFTRKTGWRFLQYKQSDDGEGVFKVLNRKHEDEMRVRDFLHQTVKNGLFICNLTPTEEMQQLFAAADIEDGRKFVEHLRTHQLNINAKDPTGFTVLHYAALNNLTSILLACLDTFGMDPNLADLCGRSPLHYAAQMGNIKACQMLLHHGADIGFRDRASFVPMDLAAAEGHDLAPYLRGDDGAKESPDVTSTAATEAARTSAGSPMQGESYV